MRISVVIPTYNRALLVERSVRSAINQIYEPFEIIVVDDGSNDNTREVVNSISSPLVKYIYQDNFGAASARNTGVSAASGDWIAFNDSDDVWREDKLLKQTEYVKQHPDYSLIYSSYEMHLKNGSSITIPVKQDKDTLEGDILIPLIVRNTIGTPTIMVKKDAFLEVGGFDNNLRCIEDWNFAIRFAEKYKIGFVEDITTDAYRVDDGVSSNIAEMFEERCRTIAKYRTLLEQKGLFENAILLMFEQAKNTNSLELVKKMLMAFLSS